MRVVAGTARGRRLAVPADDGIRPTGDRVREAMFNALHSRRAVVGATVLDLFAGTGALGIEALSRGAASAVFVEHSRTHAAIVEANLETCGFTDARIGTKPSCRLVSISACWLRSSMSAASSR